MKQKQNSVIKYFTQVIINYTHSESGKRWEHDIEHDTALEELRIFLVIYLSSKPKSIMC